MPVMEQKTPIYDLHVWFVNSPDPVIVQERMLYERAKELQDGFRPAWKSQTIGDDRYICAHVVRSKIVRSKRIVRYDWGYPITVDAWLEDEEQDADA